ncbi:uncharacterized protein A1O9_13048 [Exophiala aquamarina CBS 119918]|uniref:RRM domain-containing protein n=1 Tax=Exophiala aquamarina CBS 119918 TaxID=1182545 RepID=A0A072NSR4_9EURO|nr:uncharacterized protein A1O9_13048 [Exophiala aquamarina CBS 119918]KEF50899.1 hypothetical protein A1O9_13048 [Exophiala aquamarina CBS 119918]
MFIGGLSWETTNQSLQNYFSRFGEVRDCIIMRDRATWRSRGFGFLTFKDPKAVNRVMMTQRHVVDGTVIDPKRAIPQAELQKTAKIFVGGVSQEASQRDFEIFFAQFGRVVDATLMMDKNTGRPRGFGFVTFGSDAAMEKCLGYRPLVILGKEIEVRPAQAADKMDEDDGSSRVARERGKFDRDGRFGDDKNHQVTQGNQSQAQCLTPQMGAHYWQLMQHYFHIMQRQTAENRGSNIGNMGNMGNMSNIGMGQITLQRMKKLQMLQMWKMQGGNSPTAQDGTSGMGHTQGMNPQMRQQATQWQQQHSGVNSVDAMGRGRGFTGQGSSQDRLSALEQHTLRQRSFPGRSWSPGFQNQNTRSWEGMYDDVPQLDGGHGSVGPVRNNTLQPPKRPAAFAQASAAPANAAPANAPNGPKNPDQKMRGLGGGHRRYNPYKR